MCFIENNKTLLCDSLSGFTASAHTAEGRHWLVGLSKNLFFEKLLLAEKTALPSLSLASFSGLQYENNGTPKVESYWSGVRPGKHGDLVSVSPLACEKPLPVEVLLQWDKGTYSAEVLFWLVLTISIKSENTALVCAQSERERSFHSFTYRKTFNLSNTIC